MLYLSQICENMRDSTSQLVTLLKNERKKARISQTKMAEKLGVHVRTYMRMEKEGMGLDYALRLLSMFNIKIMLYRDADVIVI